MRAHGRPGPQAGREDPDLTGSERLNPQCARACPGGHGMQQMELALGDSRKKDPSVADGFSSKLESESSET